MSATVTPTSTGRAPDRAILPSPLDRFARPAARIMSIGALVACDAEHPGGILTDRDIVIRSAAGREGAAMTEWKRICCAVDLGEPSRMAMEEATELAKRLGAELTLVYVVVPRPPVVGEVLVAGNDGSGISLPEAEARLARWRVDAEVRAGATVRSLVLAGDPADEIVRCARNERSDLVVVGTHGRKGLRRLMLGSVAERVVRECVCPVMVVHDGAARERKEIAEEIGHSL